MTAEAAQITVEVLPSKPVSEIVRFLRYSAAVECVHCKRKSRHHWTMTISFRVAGPGGFVVRPGKVVHKALAPVCRSHLLMPEAAQ